MKWALAVVAGLVVGWFYLIDGSKLDEQMVQDFYKLQQHNTYKRDPEALCKQLGGKLKLHQESLIAGKTQVVDMNKNQACDSLRESFKMFEEMGEKAGGMLTIEYSYEITRLELAPNKKSATVDVTSTLKMGEAFLQFFHTSTERIERSMRRTQLVASDDKLRMRWTPGAMANPEKFFRAQ